VQQLGADVLYLNPIHLAWTNHKYDALDYLAISPEYGTRDDVKRLAEDVHGARHEAGAGRRVQPHGPQARFLPAGARPTPPAPGATGSYSVNAVRGRRARLVARPEPARAEPREPGGA
jgi:hypothetical protein